MTPDNPTQVGWSASKIRQYQWKPLDILFDFIELVDRASVNNVNEVITDIDGLNERIVRVETRSFDMKLKAGDEEDFAKEENQSIGDFFIIEGGYANVTEDITQTVSEASKQVSRMIMKSPKKVVAVASTQEEETSSDGGGLTTGNVSSAGSNGYIMISDSGAYAYPMGITEEIAESNAALIERRKASTTSRTSSSTQLSIPSSSHSSTTLSLEAGKNTKTGNTDTQGNQSAPALVIRNDDGGGMTLSVDGSEEAVDKVCMLSLSGSDDTKGLSLL